MTRQDSSGLNLGDDLFYDKATLLTQALIETEDDPQKLFAESAARLLTAAVMWKLIRDGAKASVDDGAA